MKIKAVLFDCDGLMFDTENYSHRIWNRIAEEEGVRLPDDFFMMITGAGRKNTEAYMNRIEGIEKMASGTWISHCRLFFKQFRICPDADLDRI